MGVPGARVPPPWIRCRLSSALSVSRSYGDKTVRSVPARLFGFLWIIVGVVIMSIFTATLTTAFSSEHLDPSDIIGLTVSGAEYSLSTQSQYSLEY